MNKEKFLPFRPVSPADKPLADRYMKPFGEGSCQHSFTALYTLSEKYGSEICEKDGFLFTLRRGLCTDNERVYLAPMGQGDIRAAYLTLLADASAHNCRAVFRTVTARQAELLRREFPGRFEYAELRDYAEYIYLSESLCVMAGKRFSDERNRIRSLLRSYGDRLVVRTLNSDDVPVIWEYENRWFKENSAAHDFDALAMEMRIIRRQLDNFEALGLSGVGIYIDGKMVAFNYGVALNDNCFGGLISKADRSIPNLYKLLFREVSLLCARPYKYFNWEEDVGVEGLRFMKTEYGPCVLMRKYLVKERAVPSHVPETGSIPMLTDIAIITGEEHFPDRLPL